MAGGGPDSLYGSQCGTQLAAEHRPCTDSKKSFDNVTSVLRESLSNAIRHASDREVDIRIDGDLNELKIGVSNRFMNPQHGEGNGLDNIKSRMLDCGGLCAISQKENVWQVELAVTLGP